MRNQIDSMLRLEGLESLRGPVCDERTAQIGMRYYDWLMAGLNRYYGITPLMIGKEEDIDEPSPVEED